MTSAMADFKALQQEFNRRGWCRKPAARVLLELALDLLLALGGIALFIASHSIWVRAAAILVSTVGSIAVGTNAHTSSHYAASSKKWVNELITYFGYPFFLGLSATYWWHKHLVVHHPAPNVIGVDEDADLLPWFARTDEQVQLSRGWRGVYYRNLQWLVLPLVLSVHVFGMQWTGIAHIVRGLRAKGRHTKYLIDVVCLLLHYATCLILPLYFFSFYQVAAFYVLRIALLGYALFAVVGPGHLPVEASCVHETGGPDNYLLLQTAATLNFRTGPIGSLMCSGMQYQIEHHLLPGISHVYYPAISPFVGAFCREHGLPYRTYRWEVAIWKSLAMFRRPPQIVSVANAQAVGDPGGR